MRVIARVQGGASRGEAAELLDISPSAAVKWKKCFQETGSCAARPRGGSTSTLEAHAPWLLTLIEKQPDLTLDRSLSRISMGLQAVATPYGNSSSATKSALKKICARRSRIVQMCQGTSIMEATASHA